MSAMIGKGGGPRGPPRHGGAVRQTGVRTHLNASPGNPVFRKKAPEGLLMLKVNGENVISWTNSIANHCEIKYGTISGFIRNNAYPVRAVQTAESLMARFPGIAQAAVTKMLVENMTTVMKQEDKDKESKFEMFAIVESCVTDEGWNRVKSRNGFAEALAAKCPLLLLRLVTMEHSLKMNNVTDNEARYIAEDRYHKVMMGPMRSLAEYYDVFDMCVNNMKTLECVGIPEEPRLARHFLMKLDRGRYEGFMRDTINDDRNGTREMQQTRQAVMDGARMHIPVQMMKAQHVTDKQSMPMVYRATEEEKQQKKDIYPCHRCKKLGHWARECTEAVDDTKVNEDKTAYHVDFTGEDLEEDEAAQDSLFGYAFKATSSEQNQKLHPREVVIDTFANVNFIFNKDLLCNLRGSSAVVKGFNGSKQISKMGDLHGFGEAVMAPWAGVNGLAMCKVEDRYTVTYFQKDRIEVKVNADFILKFAYKSDLGCYACMFNEEVLSKLKENESRLKYCNITLTSEMEKNHTTKEVVAARRARTMMRRLYYPADSALVRTITKGAMVECNTTGHDVILATDIYGSDVASLKGKTKDRKPNTYKQMLVPTMAQKEQTVFADVFHWRNVNFVIFIVKPLRLVLVQWLPKHDGPNIKAAVLTLCNKVEARGYGIREIVVDPAKELAGLVDTTSKNITVVGSRMHVSDAEVEIRTIKERMRSSTHGLPYDAARRLVRWQVYGAVMTYNMILRQGQTVSSRELFTGVKTNYLRDVRAEFGEYVQAHVSPGELNKRGPGERTVGAIAMCSADNQRGTYWFMSLKTGSFFRADRWTPLPMTDDVIGHMNRMHDQDQPLKVKMAEKRRKNRMRMDSSDRDLTRELLELPTEREEVDTVLPPATEMAEPLENDILTGGDTEDEIEVRVEELDEIESGQREYEEALARVDLAKKELDDFIVEQEYGVQENNDGNDGPIVEPEEEIELEDNEDEVERDEIIMDDPYDNFEEILNENITHKLPLGARMVGNRRMSHRIDNRRRAESRIAHAYRLTLKKALKKNEKASRESVMKELKQVLDKDVFEMIEKSSLTKKQLKKVIRSSMFLTEKFTASGEFDKLKARLVAGGDGQDKTLYDNLSSPTVAHETVMMVLAIAAIEGRKVATIDITGAYLECEFDEGDEVIMTIDPFLASLLGQIDPSVEQKKDEKGVIHVRLKKALYGCIQSAKLWYDKLCSVLEADGYVKNDYDQCLFNKVIEGVQCTVAFHVDDLLITCLKQDVIDSMEKMLKENFTAITINKGKSHSYLAMNMEVTRDGIHLDMIAYIKKCLEGRSVGRKANSPATDTLFEVPEDGVLLGDEEKKAFHSDVAKLLYLAKRTRGQILTAVSHLSGRVNAPTDDDQNKLDRVFAYLNTTADEVMHLKFGGSVVPEVYIDASYGVHADGSSRTGMVIMMAGAAIGCWSSKQKLVTKSSTEAEIVALSDGLTNAIWMREMVMAQGYDLGPTKIFEDNQGVIKIIKSGRSPKHRTRHLNVRHFFARDREKLGDIVLIYKPTDEMIADIMTKPVTGILFEKLSNQLVGTVEEVQYEDE
jgi:hypothetical protein